MLSDKPLINELLVFAFFHQRDQALDSLAELAEQEDWSSPLADQSWHHPLLYYYLVNTFRRVQEEKKIEYSAEVKTACFNTGLVTQDKKQILAYFVRNRIPDKQKWFFVKWIIEGAPELSEFMSVPSPASYVMNRSDLIFHPDSRLSWDKTYLLGELRHLLGEQVGPANYKRECNSMRNSLTLIFLNASLIHLNTSRINYGTDAQLPFHSTTTGGYSSFCPCICRVRPELTSP